MFKTAVLMAKKAVWDYSWYIRYQLDCSKIWFAQGVCGTPLVRVVFYEIRFLERVLGATSSSCVRIIMLGGRSRSFR